MLKVGLTGNIGSGKTTVSRIFEVIGIPVFHADVEAKKLYEKEEVKALVFNSFGDKVFSNNYVDFKKLANVIFSDKEHLKTINSIIHPLVFESFKDWVKNKVNHPYIIHEAAIIFENNLQFRYDAIINVSARMDVRIKRVVDRDQADEESVKQRIMNQMDDSVKSKLSDFVIYNNGEDMLIPQVVKIHTELLEKIKTCANN